MRYGATSVRAEESNINNAAANQVVTQSTASLFFHPDYPLAQLQTIVTVLGMGLYPLPFADVMHVSVNDLLVHVARSKL